MKMAMRAKNDLAVQTLRGALAAFTNELVAKGKKPTESLDDAMAIVVLKRLAKQRKDSADQFTKGGRADLAESEMAELKILEVYLPAQMSRDEILQAATAKKNELGITDMSKANQLMGMLMKNLKGKADGNVVKEVVESLLK